MKPIHTMSHGTLVTRSSSLGITFGDGPPMSESWDERPETRDRHGISTDDPVLDWTCNGLPSTIMDAAQPRLWQELRHFASNLEGTWDTFPGMYPYQDMQFCFSISFEMFFISYGMLKQS